VAKIKAHAVPAKFSLPFNVVELLFLDMRKPLLSLLLFFLLQTTQGAIIDTVEIRSEAMNKTRKCVVIIPGNKKNSKVLYPTVYLLHGYGGGYSNWIRRVPQLENYADNFKVIIVCPDGEFGSWYFDSPIDSSMRYETYVAKEIPAYIEANYPVIKDRKARAITGLSMGGHGGLFLGFRHADFFGACGSMSGALVIENITRGFQVEKRLGDTSNKQRYREYSFIEEMENYAKTDSIAIIIDCGTEDFIIEMSRSAHQKMLSLKIPHDYIERPGRHDWKYWTNAVQYQLLFFRNYFDKH
jgi:S-formylglutathione hydrolase FrmB